MGLKCLAKLNRMYCGPIVVTRIRNTYTIGEYGKNTLSTVEKSALKILIRRRPQSGPAGPLQATLLRGVCYVSTVITVRQCTFCTLVQISEQYFVPDFSQY